MGTRMSMSQVFTVGEPQCPLHVDHVNNLDYLSFTGALRMKTHEFQSSICASLRLARNDPFADCCGPVSIIIFQSEDVHFLEFLFYRI